jgi:Domain of unknown function (DUF6894)
MARYFFQVDYHGAMITDDVGEEFATVQQAEAHARLVAHELSRNDPQPVTVSVLSEGKVLLASGPENK